ncbi:MAG: phage virion morphogenesis protein [Acidobacteriota bacterium]|nr:phage virion morphogenesis protein [Acidobacteriota bacterium]
MAGVLLKLDTKETDWLSSRLRETAAKFNNLQDLMEEIGEHLVSSTLLRFERADSPEGTPWAPWSEAYAAKREGGAMLMDSERLAGSITYQAGPEQVEVGSNVIYAAIHQAGGEDVGIPIPARPYLGISPDEEIEVLEIISDWEQKQLEAA